MNQTIASLMTPAVIVVNMDDSVRKIEALLKNHQISAVPVRNGTGVVGIVSTSDLLQFHATGKDPDQAHAWDICSYKPIEVGPDTRINEVARLMLAHGIHHVLVLDHGQIVGMVSALDFVKRSLGQTG